jgi:hypothetical protein
LKSHLHEFHNVTPLMLFLLVQEPPIILLQEKRG